MNGEEWRKRICMETDTGYSYSLAKRMEKYRTNPVLGYRTAGSRAEFETGEMLVREMESLGLSDVHKDRICVDSWEFERRLGGISQHVHTGGKGGPVQGESHGRKRRMGADSGKRKMVVPQRGRQLSGQQLAADRR